MSRLARDETAEPVSRDQILRHARGQGNINFPCSADHEEDWQPYPFDPYSTVCNDHIFIPIYPPPPPAPPPKKKRNKKGVLLCTITNDIILQLYHHRMVDTQKPATIIKVKNTDTSYLGFLPTLDTTMVAAWSKPKVSNRHASFISSLSLSLPPPLVRLLLL